MKTSLRSLLGTRKIILLFVTGFLLGTVVKNIATNKTVIGFEDYKLRGEQENYNLNQLTREVIEKAQASEQNGQSSSGAEPFQGSCTQ